MTLPDVSQSLAESSIPSTPFRGIDAFRFSDRRIFFAREDESLNLLQYITIYRGVLLYGESGAGKSSLVEAGVLEAAFSDGLVPERIRVQPRPDQELVVERISISPDSPTPWLPSLFSSIAPTQRIVCSVEQFEDVLRTRTSKTGGCRSILVFDQFEEIVTLFGEGKLKREREAARPVQERIIDLIIRLHRDDALAVKFLLVFREDYLANVIKLLHALPEIKDHSVHLTTPGEGAVREIIRGPFERYPGRFEKEISADLARRVEEAIDKRSEDVPQEMSLWELQIVCLRLWESDNPDTLFEEQGLQGILENYLTEALAAFTEEQQQGATLLLDFMVTPSGARNVVSELDLLDRAQKEGIERGKARQILHRLAKTRLVRREQRWNVTVYEIASEFLTPWIREQRESRLAARRVQQALSFQTAIAALREHVDDVATNRTGDASAIQEVRQLIDRIEQLIDRIEPNNLNLL
jgi:hypothetical protein